MLLYEYGRSQYAFSRILTTVERYRRSRKIIERITPSQRVDLLVSVPSKGSFKLGVQVDTSEPDAFGGLDFDTLFALVLDRLIPTGEEFGQLIEALARIKSEEIRSSSRQDPVFSGDRFEQLEEHAEGGAYNEGLALDLLRWASNSTNREIAKAGISGAEIERAVLVIQSDLQRRRVVDLAKSRIDAQDLDKLTARIRPMFGELAVPLGKSSDRISVGSAANSSKYFFLDKERVKLIGERRLDEQELNVQVKIKNFDVESSHGSMRVIGEKGVRHFALDPSAPEDLKAKIVLAMNEDQVELVCAKYTDSNGIVTSYLVRAVS